MTTIYAHNHSIVDDRYRYSRYAEGSEELYDHNSDPLEFDNLISQAKDDQKLKAVIKRLSSYIPSDEAGAPDPISEGLKH